MIESIHSEDTWIHLMTDEFQNDSEGEGNSMWNVQEEDGIGDILQEDKPDNIVRIYYQNLNGLKWDKQGGTWPMICQAMAGIHADIACFSEINQDTKKFEIYDTMQKIASKQFDQVRLITATTKRQVKRNYKPGGTAMMTMMETTTYVKDTTKDRMGRWVSTRYTSGTGTSLTVIGAYQVCQHQRTGKMTAATQQINILTEENVQQGLFTRLNPREAFIRDITAFIQQRQQEGDLILVGGDFNEEMEDESGMSAIAERCRLVDIFGMKFETTKFPTTYKRGSKRLDYILASPEVVETIVSSGYDPFDYRGITTDHRGMFVDLDATKLFGNKPIPLATKIQRDFKATDPQAVTTYIETKWQEMTNHNLMERLQFLETTRIANHELVERFDRDMSRAAIIATKQIKQSRRHPWSPKLAKAWALIHFQKMVLSQIRNPGISIQPSIDNWRKRHSGMPTTEPQTLDEAKQAVKDAYAHLKQIRQEAAQHRQKFLDMKAELYATFQDLKKEKIIERMKNAESLHNAYTKLRRIRQTETGYGLSAVQIPVDSTQDPKECPKDDEYWTTIRDPQQIESLLIKRNQQHFGQAHGTPLTVPRIWNNLTYDGTGQLTVDILNGTYSDKYLTSTSQLFVDHMAARTTHLCKDTMNADEFLGKLRNWRETTTTSPSGLHLGHYHALWKPSDIDKTVPGALDRFEAKRKELIRAHLALINYAIKFNYPLQRWRKVVNIMLEKDIGQPKIHRLRVIHIYEADYNMMLAVKWREALQFAEDNNLLNKSAYGSRPARSAHDPVLMEVWRNGIYRTSMKSGVNQDLDATACYDRILPPVANICSQRIGVHPKVAAVNCRTLEKARFYLKTNLGVSENSYQHEPATPIYGTGQGSGNSPHLWCFISSALYDAYESKANGATFKSFDGKDEINMGIVGFVDDCTQMVNDFSAHPQPDEVQLIRMMTHDSQLWNDLLWTTGGSLELPKCSFQLIRTNWSPKGEPFLQGGADAPALEVHNAAHDINIQQTGNYTSRKTLGVHLNPSGKMKTQLAVLKTKSEKFQLCVRANILTRREAIMFFHGIFLPSITYPMAATSFTEEECSQIEGNFLKALLPAAGYGRSMAKAIRQAPVEWGGAGFRPLYGEQMVATITTAMKHIRADTPAGKMLLMNLTWSQAYAGISTPLWKDPTAKCPTVPNQWIMGVRLALKRIEGCLELEIPTVWPRQRENDWFIMDRVMQQTNLKQADVNSINACRRYLQCITAADVCNPAGTCIQSHFYTGDIVVAREDVNGEMFNQAKPGIEAWKAWKRFWKSQTRQNNRTLLIPLRSWIVQAKQCRIKPDWALHPWTLQLQCRRSDGTYTTLHQTGNLYMWKESNHNGSVPIGYPVQAFDLGQCYRVQHNYRVAMSEEPLDESWEAYLSSLDEWEREMLSCVTFSGNPEDIMRCINSSQIYAASDGSVLEQISGSFGLVIATLSDSQRILTARGAAPGYKPSSFRAEAYGALAVIRTLRRLSLFTGIEWSTGLQHWIDNDALIKRLQSETLKKYKDPSATLHPDWDVIQQFVHTWREFDLDPERYSFEWIKSHQDDHAAKAQLPLEAQLNCEADRMAAIYQELDFGHRQLVPMIKGTKCHLTIQGATITGGYKWAIRQALTLPAYFIYLRGRFDWTDEVLESIDWDSFKRIIRKYRNRQATVVKHIHGFAPTGKYANRYDKHQPAACPACGFEVECNDHLLSCSTASRVNFRDQTKQKLVKAMKSTLASDPILWHIIWRGMESVFSESTEGVTKTDFPDQYRTLIDQQNQIGWIHVFRGRWSVEWQKAHESWAIMNPHQCIKRKGKDWISDLGGKLLGAWIDLWTLRNDERHSKTVQDRETTMKAIVRSQMDEIYSYRDRLCPVDKDLIPHVDVDTHMEEASSLEALQDWCIDTYQAVLASVRQATLLGVQRNGRIEDYFSVARPRQ